MIRIKRITGYTALARFHANDVGQPIGYIIRDLTIRSPYASGPTHVVYSYYGQPVIVVETSHIRYDVYAVFQTVFRTEREAERAFMATV